jgi:hypothetical protein
MQKGIVCFFIETSSKTADNINQLVEVCIRSILRIVFDKVTNNENMKNI